MSAEKTSLTRQPLVSILINCHNGERYLHEALASVLNQTYQNWEIIFWDNHSTDRSHHIVSQYDDERIIYIRSPKFTHLGEARNLAVENSNGDWIGFLDCDDIWLPKKLAQQVSLINEAESKIDLVYGQCLTIIEKDIKKNSWSERQRKFREKTLLKKLPEGNIFNKLLLLNFIPLVTALVSRKSFFEVAGISPHLEQAEDYDLFLKIAQNKRTAAVQDIVALYRLHGKNASNLNEEKGYKEALGIIEVYLPNQIAKNALKHAHTNRGLALLKGGEIWKGVLKIIFDGKCTGIFTTLKRKIFRVI